MNLKKIDIRTMFKKYNPKYNLIYLSLVFNIIIS